MWSLREYVRSGSPDRTARIAATDAELRAWVLVDPAPGTGEGPLAGAPLGVKDIIDLAGFPTRCGAALRAQAAPATSDAPIVTAWRRAGAAPVGKTVTTEFAYFFPGPTRNPAAPGRTPGGSSSGSAAAVAAGQVPLALGTQTAGSVIRPASFCGVAALVMTHGRFPMTGVSALAPSLDSHGFFAASVSDVALAWSALTGARDADLSSPAPPRLLVWPGSPDPAMASALATARARLAAAGAEMADFPGDLAAVTSAHMVVMAYEAARAIVLPEGAAVSEQLTSFLATGAAIPDEEYAAARSTIADTVLPSPYDAVLAPGAPGPPPPAALLGTGDPMMSRPWQALGLPSVAVPGHRDAAGLPLGLQLIGHPNEETALLTTGCWVERALAVAGHQV
jgi:Asp-tRNA(Asn)/Glu-tRNA(Gln) amidotransferase A subunit family amidase